MQKSVKNKSQNNSELPFSFTNNFQVARTQKSEDSKRVSKASCSWNSTIWKTSRLQTYRPSDFWNPSNSQKNHSKKAWKAQSKKVVWACICLGYFSSFWTSELLTKTSKAYDPSSTCSWADIGFKSNTKLSVRVKNPKTLGGKSETINLFALPDNRFCPIKAMQKLWKNCKKRGFFSAKSASFPVRIWQVFDHLCSLWYSSEIAKEKQI